MNMETNYSIDQLTDVAVGLRQTLTHIERLTGAVESPPMERSKEGRLLTAAKRLVKERKDRVRFFESSDFGEPVWDLMLDLYIARSEKRQISVSSACIAAAVPPTTALRYIVLMTEDGKIKRVPDPYDARRVHVALCDETTQKMEHYLTAMSSG